MIEYNGDKNNLIEIIEFLTLKHQFEFVINTGSRDVTGGYGWHVVYSVKVFKSDEYCTKCMNKEGVYYSDTAHPFSNHSYRTITKQVFDIISINCEKICKDLLENYKNWQ